ncbi:DEAD/DEAH box helicase [Sediminitomix flava]|uniref:ATP-dependent RNA helicase RhlE n=1 Tax=Sediminitomix flava TaxID=379075 RepID=A0A315ZDJ8_SEDFL|nr:DEAD/DEAH box helicase [Sediminitomix flava]PWJ43190.1 ATP-dependent RNA helicase RhlE [Sediminitomix flava]
MNTFDDFKIKKQLRYALTDLGLEQPTPIQEASYSTILGGADFVGIAQTGTGKTIAYLLPMLQELKYSDQPNPRVLILAPTRELVIQIVEQIEKLTEYIDVRVVGVYGGSNNMNRQKQAVAEGVDIIVGTPRRLYDLALTNVLRLKSIKKLIIDEADVMLDFGYKTQLRQIFEYLPEKRQNVLFSATMTTYVDSLIDDFLVNPVRKTIAVSGTPVETIQQEVYEVPNFNTKANLLNYLLEDREKHHKVLIFVGSKVIADKLAETLNFLSEISVIHSSKEQNHRIKSIEKFEDGTSRILIATDVIARGIDIENISTVISFDTPFYPENYIHRIGRTGRAQQEGRSILFFNEKERELKDAIEALMNYEIPLQEFPEQVEVSFQLIPEEKEKPKDFDDEPSPHKKIDLEAGAAFHEKKPKNNREKQEKKSYKQKLQERYKKPIKRGDKIQNMKKRKNKKRW